MLSMFTVTGQVMKTFYQQGKTDKETGEIDEGSHKVQLLGEMPVKGGQTRLDLITLSIENAKTYTDLQGKKIRIPLGFFAPSKGQIIYYIPKGAVPEVLA
jgi:hypothetical protein